MRISFAVAGAVALAGCAQQQPVVDDTPENPTAVFETTTSSTGIGGMFPFETTEKRYVRANMRRDEQATRGTGRFSGYFVTRLTGQGDTIIGRLDRKLMWTLDNKRKEYVECPVHGCPMPADAQEQDASRAEEQQRREEPKQQTEEGCTMRVVANKFDVKPTGQKRSLHGFDTDQYEAAWVMRMEDKQKRATTSTVKFDIWTTPVNAQMRQAMDTEAAYGRAFLASAPRDSAMAKAMADAQAMQAQLVPMMTSYLTALNPNDRAALGRALREYDKIKGHPISTKIEWFVDGNACGAKEQEQQAAQPQGTMGIVSGIAGSLFKKKEEPAGPKPVLSYTIEVKRLGMQPVRDSTFAVPASYKQVKLP